MVLESGRPRFRSLCGAIVAGVVSWKTTQFNFSAILANSQLNYLLPVGFLNFVLTVESVGVVSLS